MNRLGRVGRVLVGLGGIALSACTSGDPGHPGAEPPVAVGTTTAPLIWTPGADLSAPSLRYYENFGASVAATETVVVVGAPAPPGWIGTSGAAYVFTKNGSWAFKQRLVPSEGSFFAFGTSVAVSGDTIVVGAPADDTDVGNEGGSAFVFVASKGTWIEQQRVRPADIHPLMFGQSVAVEGDLAVVGQGMPNGYDPRYALIYRRAGSTWSEEKVPVNALGSPGASVALSGGNILFGCPDTAHGNSSVHVLEPTGDSWIDEELPGFATSSTLGTAVALSGNTALVGDGAGNAAVYVRAKTGDSGTLAWSRSATLVGRIDNYSPYATVALFGETMAIVSGGRPFPYGQPLYEQGKVFTLSGGQWAESQTLDRIQPVVGVEPAALAVNSDSIFMGWGRAVTEWRRADENGKPCSDPATCASGYCTDGVCCNGPCDESCDVCSASRGAIEDGTCTLAHGGGDPVCTAGACDGVHTACPCSTDTDCPEEDFCGATSGAFGGTCKRRLVSGTPCAFRSGEGCRESGCRICASPPVACLDGFCCDRPCEGPCETCDLASSPGKCTPVPGCTVSDSGLTPSDGGGGGPDAGLRDAAARSDATAPSRDSGTSVLDATSPGSGGSDGAAGGTPQVSSGGKPAGQSAGGAPSTADAGESARDTGTRVVGCGCVVADARDDAWPSSMLAVLLSIGSLRRARRGARRPRRAPDALRARAPGAGPRRSSK
ncbi:MAG TPA: FG-GAP repeat protein, partial [Polyangiaceae bacterium]|nr:FG-GAP repeat protein [Polyangiaceae bacterium]